MRTASAPSSPRSGLRNPRSPPATDALLAASRRALSGADAGERQLEALGERHARLPAQHLARQGGVDGAADDLAGAFGRVLELERPVAERAQGIREPDHRRLRA